MRKPAETVTDPFAPEASSADVDLPSEGSPAEASKRRGWRRLLQVNLLMVLVALALVSGYFAMRRNFLVPYLEQRAAREELAKRGAQFSAVPANPRWVQALFQISDDDFQNVEMIKLENSEGIRDADLIHLHKFPHLRRLYLAATRVTDDGMKHLRYCTKLRRISLWDTQVGDAGIRELETLQDLRIIDIHRTWTTDAALETLGKLPALEELVLDDATTKRGIAHLAGLKNLRRLNLRGTSLQADCLEHLAACPIEILEVKSDFADRESARNFRHVPRVRELYLSIPGAIDEDLEWLGQMKNLRSAYLHELRAEGAFARRLSDLPRLESLNVQSDRLRKEALFQLVSAPRLKEATIAAPITEDDLKSIPKRRMSLRLSSPWLSPGLHDLRSHDLKREPRIEVIVGLDSSDARFAFGEAETFASRVPNYATVDFLEPLLRQKGLRELHVFGWEFAPGALAALGRLDRLEVVALEHCRFDPVELRGLAKLPHLRRFVVRDAPVRDEQLAAFVAAPSLEALDVHLTDADPATVLALVKKEQLRYLSVSSTTLNDAFLDEVDAILAPRAKSAVKSVALDGAPQESLPRYRFSSTGFSTGRAEAFRNRYQIAIGVAKEPGTDLPKRYWGVWPAAGTFGWIDPAKPNELELSPLEVDLSIIDQPQGESALPHLPLWRAAYAEFAYAYASDSFGEPNWPGSRPADEAASMSSWKDWQIAPLGAASQTVQISLGRFGHEATRQLLESASQFLSLAGGEIPLEALEGLSRSRARAVILGAGCRYDEATLQAIANMPLVETVHFGTCRKPAPEEIAILYGSATLRTIEFEHFGEPVYFEEIARSDRRPSAVILTGKVVYNAVDAVRERPPSLILANFDEQLWPSILAAPQSLTDLGMRDDQPNHWRLRLRLEVLQRERDAAAKAEEATGEATPANLRKPVEAAY